MSPSEAEAINRERVISKLLSAAVHDARNALQGISGTAELLSMGPSNGHSDDRIRSIQRQAAWMGERLEQLLQLNLDRPQQPERLDAARLCARTFDLRKASWARMRVKGLIDAPPGVMVLADMARLERILVNLVLNAEAALVAGGVGGQITLTVLPESGAATFVVEDSGLGVASDVERQLFSLHGSAGRLTTGLQVSRSAAESMGGTLTWLGPARRSAFSLRLPAAPSSSRRG